jgi:RND family efflux transporter MFP subunit
MFFRTRMKTTCAVALTLSALFLAACEEEDAAEPAASAPVTPAVSVFSTNVLREELIKPVTGTGTIAAQKTTDVGPLVDGIIEEVFVHVGDRVSEGDPLFKTRDVELRLRVRELESQYQLSEAEARNASRELTRIKELSSNGFASTGHLDNVQTAYDIADARLGVARARLDAALQSLSDATVKAPFDGVVTAQNIYEGKFMATRMGGGMGGPSGVVQVMKIDIVGAIINVPEVYVGDIALGTRARVYVDGIGGIYDSEIHIFNDSVDHITRSVEVRVGLANPDYEIKPGMFVRAEFFPPAREALTVDRKTVLGIEGRRYVFIEDAAGRAKRMPVRTTQIDASRVEIVDGLSEGDIVLSGPMISSLVEGMPVRIEQSPSDVGPTSSFDRSVSTAEAR